jgi:hypothetical protein
LESKVGQSGGESGDSPVDLIRLVAMNVDRLQVRPEDEEIIEEIKNLLQVSVDLTFIERMHLIIVISGGRRKCD